MPSHFHLKISKGCSTPEDFWCSILTFWHTKHLLTTSCPSSYRTTKTSSLGLDISLSCPNAGCTVKLLLSASSMILLRRLLLASTQTLCWYLHSLSVPLIKSFNFPFSTRVRFSWNSSSVLLGPQSFQPTLPLSPSSTMHATSSGSRHLLPHWPFQGGSSNQNHNHLGISSTFSNSCSAPFDWRDTSNSYGSKIPQTARHTSMSPHLQGKLNSNQLKVMD